jgi:cytoskeletal protein CcmA (bactofilin family)
MGLRDNLNQALKEMMHRNGLASSEIKKQAQTASDLNSFIDVDIGGMKGTDSPEQDTSGQHAPDAASGINDEWPEPPSFEKRKPDASSIFAAVEGPQTGGMNRQSDELTVISKNTVIDGNIRTLASLTIDGSVRGRVDVMRDSKIRGMLIGDMVCNNSEMYGSSIQGDVFAKGSVRIDSDSILLGDVKAQYISIDGKVKGNVDAGSKVQLLSNAIISGNISSGAISIVDGANVSGFINTTFFRETATARSQGDRFCR